MHPDEAFGIPFESLAEDNLALAKAACILDRAEAFWELGWVLQGLELTFRERVVVGDVGPAALTAATDNLAKLLGKKKRSFNKPWYDGLES